MHYLLLAYRDEKQWAALSADQQAALAQAELTIEQELRQSGHLLAAENLQNSSNTLTVQVVHGKLSLTDNDGPFAETKGPLPWLYLINARDLNEAIHLAAKLPQAHTGSVEVRPIPSSE